jgi:hypothetical protein
MNIDRLPSQQLSSDSTLSGWTLYPVDYAEGSSHHVNDEQHDYRVSYVCAWLELGVFANPN